MQPRRRELEAVHLEVLDLLLEHHREQHSLHDWAAIARRIVAAEPWREEVQCELMTCYARQGQHSLALRQFQACVVALRSALGATPSEDTLALVDRIRRRDV